MKKLFLILLTLHSLFAFSQPVVVRSGPANTVSDYNLRAMRNLLLPRFLDTASANLMATQHLRLDSCGAVISTFDNKLWKRDCSPKRWTEFGGVGFETITIRRDSIFVTTRDTVYYVGTFDSTSFNNAIKGKVDSVTFSHGPTLDSVKYWKDGTSSLAGLVQRKDGLLSGGVVTWVSGLTFDISAAVYSIGGVIYTSPTSQITLSTADATNPRLDVLAVNTAGLVVKLTGTAQTNPAQPQTDPASQIGLTTILVPAGATTPPTIVTTTVYDENVPPEWTATNTDGLVAGYGATSPVYHLDKSLEINNYTSGSALRFIAPETQSTSLYSTLKFWLRLTAPLTSENIAVQFYKNGQSVSNAVNSSFTKSTINAWQSATLNFSQFSFTQGSFDELRLVFSGTSSVNTYIDYIQLQGGILQSGSSGIRDTVDIVQLNDSMVVFRQPGINRRDTLTFSGGTGGIISETDPISVHLTDSATMLSPYLRKADTTNKWVNNATLSAAGDSLIVYKNGVRTATKVASSSGGIDSLSKASGAEVIKAFTGSTLTDSVRIRRYYNVVDYGADITGATDATTAIQSAINAADAAGGGVVYFPNGIYTIAGAINATYTAQLYIPTRLYSDPLRGEIILEGESSTLTPNGGGLSLGATTPTPTSGVVLKSTLATFTTAGQAVIGTAGTPNATTLSVKNINIQVKNNPSGSGPVVGGLSWKNGANISLDNVSAYIDTAGYRSTMPANEVTGFEFPDNSYGELYSVRNTVAVGFRNGYKGGEHINFNNANAMVCYRAFHFKAGYHTSTAQRVGSYWCAYDIYVSGAITLANFNLDAEWQQAGKWYDAVNTIKDSANLAKGPIFYTIVAAGTGVDNTKFTQSGGSNIRATPVSTGVLKGSVRVSQNPQNPTTEADFGIVSSAYKTLAVNDAFIYSNTGNFSILNENGTGNINLAAGGATTPHFTITSAGVTSMKHSNAGAGVSIQNTNASGFSGIEYYNATGSLHTFTGANNASGEFRFNNVATSGFITFKINSTDRFKINNAGTLTASAYGAGTATFDASGNITSSSDERLKTGIKPYGAGLKELLKVSPIQYRWNQKSGLETKSTYAGFSAQNVRANIPLGTGEDEKGYLTLQDRAIMATLVNAVKEQQAQIDYLKKEIKRLKKARKTT